MAESPYIPPPSVNKPLSARSSNVILYGLIGLALLLSVGALGLGASALLYFRLRDSHVDISLPESGERELNVRLARGSEARPLTSQARDLFIDIDDAGSFSVEKIPMTSSELEAFLQQQMAAEAGAIAVKIRPAAQAPLPSYVDAINICAKVGITDTSLVTGAAP